jgi:hypothetical protein
MIYRVELNSANNINRYSDTLTYWRIPCTGITPVLPNIAAVKMIFLVVDFYDPDK